MISLKEKLLSAHLSSSIVRLYYYVNALLLFSVCSLCCAAVACRGRCTYAQMLVSTLHCQQMFDQTLQRCVWAFPHT